MAPNYHLPSVNTDERLFPRGKSILPRTIARVTGWGLFLFTGEEREGIVHSHQKWTEWGFLWGTDPAPGVPGHGEHSTAGGRHRRSAWFLGSAKATGEQKMRFLALALPRSSSHSLISSRLPSLCSLPFPDRDPQRKQR